jgi:hypothetical protein
MGIDEARHDYAATAVDFVRLPTVRFRSKLARPTDASDLGPIRQQGPIRENPEFSHVRAAARNGRAGEGQQLSSIVKKESADWRGWH